MQFWYKIWPLQKKKKKKKKKNLSLSERAKKKSHWIWKSLTVFVQMGFFLSQKSWARIIPVGVCTFERSYPKGGVGQIWKQYLKQLKNYAHIWKLKHCANADADVDADRRRRQRLGDNISSLGT